MTSISMILKSLPQWPQEVCDKPMIAILSDISSNLQALEAVMADAKAHQVTEYICLGDVVGYGANPSQCLDIALKYFQNIIMGNQEAGLCDLIPESSFNEHARRALFYQKEQIDVDRLLLIRNWPGMHQRTPYVFLHGSVMEQFGYMNEALDFRENNFVFTKKYPDCKVCFFGHTHEQVYFKENQVTHPEGTERLSLSDSEKPIYINPGSVGQPRGGRGPQARYLLLDPESESVEFRAVDYDVQGAVEAIRQAGLPRYLGDRLLMGI